VLGGILLDVGDAKMTLARWVLLLAIALILPSGHVWAVPITVGDPSFENPGLTNYNTFTGPSPWVYIDYNNEPNGYYHGLYTPTASDYTAGSDGLVSGIVPDGTQVFRMAEGKILQILPVTLAANQTFSVSVWVGTPKTDGSPASSTSLALDAGTPKGSPNNNVNYLAGVSPVSPSDGQWLDETFTLNTNSISSSYYGMSLELLFGNLNENINVDFDKVTISCTGTGCPTGTPVPEPSTLALFGVGLAALGLIRRRKAGRADRRSFL